MTPYFLKVLCLLSVFG